MIFVLGGVALMITAMNNRRRLIEIVHRERLAMIERGLVPAPEMDPAGFEAGAGLASRRGAQPGERYRTAGVIMIGMGLGLMVLLTFAAGAADIGVGVGGAWAVVGAALLLNYFLVSRREVERSAAHGGHRCRRTRRPHPPTSCGRKAEVANRFTHLWWFTTHGKSALYTTAGPAESISGLIGRKSGLFSLASRLLYGGMSGRWKAARPSAPVFRWSTQLRPHPYHPAQGESKDTP